MLKFVEKQHIFRFIYSVTIIEDSPPTEQRLQLYDEGGGGIRDDKNNGVYKVIWKVQGKNPNRVNFFCSIKIKNPEGPIVQIRSERSANDDCVENSAILTPDDDDGSTINRQTEIKTWSVSPLSTYSYLIGSDEFKWVPLPDRSQYSIFIMHQG